MSRAESAEAKRRWTRRQQWALFFMGAWLTGVVCTSVVATQNFFTIDRLLANSSVDAFRAIVDRLGQPTTRELMRYLSSELNRLYFQWWNLAQMAIGILVLWLVAKMPRSRRAVWGVTAMLAVVLLLMVGLTPQIVTIGRSLDFVPREPAPAGLRTFGLLHAAFSVFTLINLVLGILVTRWIQRAGES